MQWLRVSVLYGRASNIYLKNISMMRSGSPDIQWLLEEMIAEGDMVAARFTIRGTHKSAFFGVPAIGRKVEARAIDFHRFTEWKILEERSQPDLSGPMQQIGAILI
jgi:predicted ester cyclase